MTRWIEQLTEAVDPDRFLAMTQVYHDAAQVPLQEPTAGGPGFHLKDNAMNRGMFAVVGALRKLNDQTIVPQAYLHRLMLLSDVFESRLYFGDFIRPGTDGDDSIEVSDALFKAVAVARLRDEECRPLDLVDVLAHAQRFAALEQTT